MLTPDSYEGRLKIARKLYDRSSMMLQTQSAEKCAAQLKLARAAATDAKAAAEASASAAADASKAVQQAQPSSDTAACAAAQAAATAAADKAAQSGSLLLVFCSIIH